MAREWSEEDLITLIEREFNPRQETNLNRLVTAQNRLIEGISHLLTDQRFGQSDRVMSVQRVIQRWREVSTDI